MAVLKWQNSVQIFLIWNTSGSVNLHIKTKRLYLIFRQYECISLGCAQI